jgi:peptidoglycan-associated lipoprotein
MRPTIRTLQLLSLGALVALGCASTTGTAPAPAPTPTASTEKKPSQEVTMQPASADSLDPIYFDTDQSVLRADARSALKARAEAIKQHPEWGVVTIQGHCDERGSDEYNLALGDRRAAVVKRYLIDLGVPPTRLGTVTFGESRPAVVGHDETAWRYNRRSELAKESLQSATR